MSPRAKPSTWRGVRVESAVVAGRPVPTAYDSLLAKIIAHGATRDQAIARMRAALAEVVVEGVTPNVELPVPILAQRRPKGP